MGMQHKVVTCCLLAALAALCHGAPLRRGPPVGPYRYGRKPASIKAYDRQLIDRCKVYFRNATLDHFSWVSSPSFYHKADAMGGMSRHVIGIFLAIPNAMLMHALSVQAT